MSYIGRRGLSKSSACSCTRAVSRLSALQLGKVTQGRVLSHAVSMGSQVSDLLICGLHRFFCWPTEHTQLRPSPVQYWGSSKPGGPLNSRLDILGAQQPFDLCILPCFLLLAHACRLESCRTSLTPHRVYKREAEAGPRGAVRSHKHSSLSVQVSTKPELQQT